MESLFGILTLGCGLYCLYGFYMLKFKGEINRTILLPKNIDAKRCKDLKGYCQEVQTPLLVLGIVTTLYGAVDLYNTYVGGVDILFLSLMGALVITLFVYVILIRRINQKYFGI